MARADIITIHCPLTPETRGLINAEKIALMKPTAVIVNTARGPIIDLKALAAALERGRSLAPRSMWWTRSRCRPMRLSTRCPTSS